MTVPALLALIALVPASLNAGPAAAGRSLLSPVCTGDGLVRMVRIPLDPPIRPGSDPAGCCVKGCHANGSRKRGSGKP